MAKKLKLKVKRFWGLIPTFAEDTEEPFYVSPRLATINATLRSFQYKVLNNVFFLNKKLYTFGITNTALCSFYNTLQETSLQIFLDCVHVKCFWERLRMKFQNDFILQSLTPQTTILGLYNKAYDNCNILSHIFMILNYICISREKWTLNIDILIANLIKVKKREKQISIVTINKREAYKNKWYITDNILSVT